MLRQNEFGPSDNLQSVARTNNDDEVSTLCNKRISVEYQSVITEDELAACYVSQILLLRKVKIDAMKRVGNGLPKLLKSLISGKGIRFWQSFQKLGISHFQNSISYFIFLAMKYSSLIKTLQIKTLFNTRSTQNLVGRKVHFLMLVWGLTKIQFKLFPFGENLSLSYAPSVVTGDP